MSKQETINEVIAFLISDGKSFTADLIKKHYAKQEKPFDRWYVSETSPDYIAFEGLDYRYGISIIGQWFNGYTAAVGRIILESHRLATDAEILEKLSAHATSIGIKVGATIITIKGPTYHIGDHWSSGFQYGSGYNGLYFNGYPIMQDGKWVTVVEEKTIEERLTALENRL
jgi:hypothetical protein